MMIWSRKWTYCGHSSAHGLYPYYLFKPQRLAEAHIFHAALSSLKMGRSLSLYAAAGVLVLDIHLSGQKAT